MRRLSCCGRCSCLANRQCSCSPNGQTHQRPAGDAVDDKVPDRRGGMLQKGRRGTSEEHIETHFSSFHEVLGPVEAQASRLAQRVPLVGRLRATPRTDLARQFLHPPTAFFRFKKPEKCI